MRWSTDGSQRFGNDARGEASEAPDDSGRCAVIVLRRAGIAGVHVVSLKAPGEVLERKLVIEPAANIDKKRIIDKSAGIQVPHADHCVDEWPKLSDVGGDAGTADEVVLSHSGAAVKAAGVDDKPDMRKAREGNGFKGAVPSAIALPIDDVSELSVGNARVNVSIGQEAVELC